MGARVINEDLLINALLLVESRLEAIDDHLAVIGPEVTKSLKRIADAAWALRMNGKPVGAPRDAFDPCWP